MNLETYRELVLKNVKYVSAFQRGYDYAYGNDDWGFGEHQWKTDVKHIPKNIKDKHRWWDDWQYGCAIGTEY